MYWIGFVFGITIGPFLANVAWALHQRWRERRAERRIAEWSREVALIDGGLYDGSGDQPEERQS